MHGSLSSLPGQSASPVDSSVKHQRFDKANPSKAQRNAFDCGVPTLNRWLASQARQSMATRDAVTSLLLDDDAGEAARIAGYYCLSSGEVARDATPCQMGRRASNHIPAVRIARNSTRLNSSH